MTSVNSVEEVCNLALDAVGYPAALGDIYEGTKAGRIALRLYAQTRDELLREKDWGFARQDVALTLLKTAPVGGFGAAQWTSAAPPPPWIYEYAYPEPAVKVRALRRAPIFMPEFDPKPHVFSVANDPTVSPSKVILANLAGAIAVCTGQVTDMTQWEPLFVAALVERLARKFAEALSPGMLQEAAAEEGAALAIADGRLG